MLSYIDAPERQERPLQGAASHVSEVLFRITNNADLTGLLSLALEVPGAPASVFLARANLVYCVVNGGFSDPPSSPRVCAIGAEPAVVETAVQPSMVPAESLQSRNTGIIPSKASR